MLIQASLQVLFPLSINVSHSSIKIFAEVSIYYVQGTALGTGDAVLSKTDNSPTLKKFVSKKREMNYKLVDK